VTAQQRVLDTLDMQKQAAEENIDAAQAEQKAE
jgi:hypothetical protein